MKIYQIKGHHSCEYTDKINKPNHKKIRKKLLKNWQKSVILGQFLAFMTLTFNRLFLDILSLFLNNNVLCNIFSK